MQSVQFIKMEGIGNDYVFIDHLGSNTPIQAQTSWIQGIADRHFGVGGDGLVLIEKSDRAAARMVMFNADGSQSAMCGNALRCIGLYVFEKSGQRDFQLESDIGLHQVRVVSGEPGSGEAILEVNQGAPIFERPRIPFAQQGPEPAQNASIQLTDGTEYHATVLSMGNPHCVIFVDDADAIELEKIGPRIENHPDFPERTNVEFVAPDITMTGQTGLYQRTWERGSGETLACGSGACAVAVAAILAGKFEHTVPIRLRGGSLELSWAGLENPAADVLLRGPARIVFKGEYPAP